MKNANPQLGSVFGSQYGVGNPAIHQSINSGGGSAGKCIPAPRDETAIDRAKYVMKRAEELSDRIQVLADKLCGCIPEPCSTVESAQDGPFAILDDLRMSADQAEEAINSAMLAINRIERSI